MTQCKIMYPPCAHYYFCIPIISHELQLLFAEKICLPWERAGGKYFFLTAPVGLKHLQYVSFFTSTWESISKAKTTGLSFQQETGNHKLLCCGALETGDLTLLLHRYLTQSDSQGPQSRLLL